MKILSKLSRCVAVGILSLSILAVSLNGLLTPASAATKAENVIITCKSGTVVYDENLEEDYDIGIKLGAPAEDRAQAYEIQVKSAASEMGVSYPKFEILKINGVPWQETKWADLIKSKFMAEDKDTGWVAYPPTIRQLIFDPRLNGKGYEINSMVEAGKTADEVRAALLKGTVSETTTPAPTTTETPTTTTPEPNNSTSTPATDTTNTSPVEQPSNYQIVLSVGQKSGSEIKGDVNQQLQLEVAPEVVGESTMIPIHGVIDHFDAVATWNSDSKTVTIVKGDKTVKVTVGSTKAYVNDKEVTLQTAPVVRNGRVLIPLRFVSENIGLQVNWNATTHSIIVQ